MSEYEHDMVYWRAEFAVSDELPDMEVEIETPKVKVQCALGELALIHTNTTLYVFTEKWEHINHIYHRPEEEAEPIYMFDMPQKLMDTLFENEYRYHFSPYPLAMDLIAYHDYIRGQDPIEVVTEKLLEADSYGEG